MSWFDQNQPPTNGTPSINGGNAGATSINGNLFDNSFGGYGSNPEVQAWQEALSQGLTGQDAVNYVKSKVPNATITYDPSRPGNFDISTGGPNGLQLDQNGQGIYGVHPYNDAFGQGGSLSGMGSGSNIFGSSGMGGPFTPPTGVDYLNDPGVQFRMDQALRAIQNSAAAKGTLLTGGTLKDIAGFVGNQAAGEYGNVFNRALQTHQTNFGDLNTLGNTGLTATVNA